MENNGIFRKDYLYKLNDLKDVNVIKVVTGMRRSGKSTLLQQFSQQLKNDSQNVIEYNFEDLQNKKYLNDIELLNHEIESKLTNEKNYIFFDEIQKIEGFEELVDSLFIKTNTDIYITGSNAKLLSGELATLLSGRYVEIKMFPYSFKEFKQAIGNVDSDDDLLYLYMQIGSLPEVSNMYTNSVEQIGLYIKNVYDTIVNKDLIERHAINGPENFEKVTNFVYDSIGSEISSNNISNALASVNINISKDTVEKYLYYLEQSYIFLKSNRYDIKGKNILKTLPKYYAMDTGMRQILLGKDRGSDLGHLLENIVYIELLRRGNQVNVGKIDSNEVDFICKDINGYTIYYQVSLTVLDEKTLEHELRPLQKIKDNNEKILLTLDKGEFSHNGIKQKNVIKWLLE